MSQYKAQLHAVLDLPVPKTLTPRVSSSIMLNILGGATPSAHLELVELARNTIDDDMDVYLHLYNKASKPGRKIGHITLTSSSTIHELEVKAKPFIELVNQIRVDRLNASAETLRPKQEVAATTPASSSSSQSTEKPLVLITMGSDSDLPVLKAGLDVLREFGVPYALDITSAHRTPRYMMRVAGEAAGRGIRVIIAAAGGAAHLPGMLSSETPLPVIGVPVKATHLDGMDSLLSIVQMPVSSHLLAFFEILKNCHWCRWWAFSLLPLTKSTPWQRGVPTATVGINNSTNAALLAIRILGTFVPEYQDKMKRYQAEME